MRKITIDIVCPTYGKYEEIVSLYNSFFDQKNIEIKNIVFPLTISTSEETEQIESFYKQKGIKYFLIKKEDFSHSLTRQKAIIEYCESRCVVMLSQDVKLVDELSLYNLVKSIDSNETAYNYGRQICTNHSIERYIRKKNYPKKSLTVSNDDIEKYGLLSFFSSDAFSAYDRDIFLKIGGYNGYDVMMSEDMLYSYFVLKNGYKKAYVSEALVNHSHKYKLKQLYKRYEETGKFFNKVKIFDDYGATGGGLKLAIYVFFQALIHFNIPVLFRWLPDMCARYFGMRKGKKES